MWQRLNYWYGHQSISSPPFAVRLSLQVHQCARKSAPRLSRARSAFSVAAEGIVVVGVRPSRDLFTAVSDIGFRRLCCRLGDHGSIVPLENGAGSRSSWSMSSGVKGQRPRSAITRYRAFRYACRPVARMVFRAADAVNDLRPFSRRAPVGSASLAASAARNRAPPIDRRRGLVKHHCWLFLRFGCCRIAVHKLADGSIFESSS